MALVLARRKDQAIRIGDEIRITVIEFIGGKVKLKIEAPRDVPVHRQEVWEAIQAQRLQGDTNASE